MSVINQVLNQLEQRGVHATEQTMVRSVPLVRRRLMMPLLLFGLAIVVAIASWQWVKTGNKEAVQTNLTKAVNIKVSVEPKTSALQSKITESELLQADIPAINPSALRLSFELKSVPLPVTVQSIEKTHDEPGLMQHISTDTGRNPTDQINIPANQEITVMPELADQQPAATIDSNEQADAPDSLSPMKRISPVQQADAEYRKATAQMQQGRTDEALAGYETALRLDAGHDAARQALIALLLEKKRGTDAERVLREKLASKPDHIGFTMLLARLQVDRGAVAEAMATLENALPYANSQADFHAFLAALLQRQNRNEDAIAHYQNALQLEPKNGIWQMGYGISLLAMQRNAEAKEAFNRALDTQTLSSDLQSFVRQKLKEF